MTDPQHIYAIAASLHAEHVREFTWMGGDHLANPVLVEQCGNCQRWARYAANLLTDAAMLDALTRHGVLTREGHCDAAYAELREFGGTRIVTCGEYGGDEVCPSRYVTKWVAP